MKSLHGSSCHSLQGFAQLVPNCVGWGGSETAVNMGNFLPKLQFGKTGTIQGFRAFCKVLKNRGSFSIEFPGPRKSWKNSLILESPGN